ncbi:hypothetical protein KJ652_06060 [Patescibacteria group bacterium]|nr:hypothetical protein [Patescibacteria group bacterium]
MNENDYLKMIETLEGQMPMPSDKDIEWRRWMAKLLEMESLICANLGKIPGYINDEYTRKYEMIIGHEEEKRIYEWEAMSHNFKNGLLLLRDWIQSRFNNPIPSNNCQKNIKPAWAYYADGQNAGIHVCGKWVQLTDPKQRRKNFGIHLIDLISLPDREGIVLKEELIIRLKEQKIQIGGKADPFKQALRTINNKVGKSPKGREFLEPTTSGGCRVNEEYLNEMANITVGQV